MTFRATGIARLAVAVLAVLALSACTSGGAAGEAAAPDRAMIELAVSTTCDSDSSAQCVSVNSENISTPAAFEEANVEDAVAVEGDEQSIVVVTLTDEGRKVLNTLTKQALKAGDTARLVMKAGGEIVSASIVMEALDTREVSIVVPAEEEAQDLVDAILGH